LAVERGRCTVTGIDSTLGEIWELQKMISVIQKKLSFRIDLPFFVQGNEEDRCSL
jgi:hypothetical protein